MTADEGTETSPSMVAATPPVSGAWAAVVGFWSTLVGIAAYVGAVTSSFAAWSETFRIEDRAYDLGGHLSAYGGELFEHFRPDQGFFLDWAGAAMCVVAAISAAIAATVWRRPGSIWPLAVLTGIVSGAVIALCAVVGFSIYASFAGLAGLGALAYVHASRLPARENRQAASRGHRGFDSDGDEKTPARGLRED